MNNLRSTYWFGPATTKEEFEQIHRLNHKTFVSEIPQHPASLDGRLIDRFHSENHYVVCKDNSTIVGMIAVRTHRPFSLDAKLPDLDRYLPTGRQIAELRLLAVASGHRHRQVLPGLVREVIKMCLTFAVDTVVISGTVRQLRLYRRLGFRNFGPLVGSDSAQYQPMMLALDGFALNMPWLFDNAIHGANEKMLMVPGPAQMSATTMAGLARAPAPHRSMEVARLLASCTRTLLALSGADHVLCMLGSGTLANDAIAIQLAARQQRGLILSNGEFGNRLIDHARRASLDFAEAAIPWGKPFEFDQLAVQIGHVRPDWIWMVHCETSTGMINDIDQLKVLADRMGACVVLDCISSLGNVPVDLRDIELASGVSGKGLAAPPGIAMVFFKHGAIRPTPRSPRYLDLSLYERSEGIPFTQSSNLLEALALALQQWSPDQFQKLRSLQGCILDELRVRQIDFLQQGVCAPFVVTIALPPRLRSCFIAARMSAFGVWIAWESAYLKERNWVQLAWMGESDPSTAIAAARMLGILCSAPLGDPGSSEALKTTEAL